MRTRRFSGTLMRSHVLAGLASFAVTAVVLLFLQDVGFGGALGAGVRQRMAPERAALELGGALLLTAAVSVVLSLYFWYTGTRVMRMKLAGLADASALFAAGKLAHRIPADGDDDVAVTADRLNAMASRLQAQVRSLQELADQNLALRREAELSAVMKERERVRRELHDRVSQDLFGLAMLCRTADAQRSHAQEDALALLPEMSRLARQTQGAMRALLLELRPAQLEQRELTAALSALVREVSDRTEVPISFTVQGPEKAGAAGKLAPSLEDALYLIAQEGIANALRHGKPSRVDVVLFAERERVVLRVRDDGVGLKATAGGQPGVTSVGLRSMRERAEALGGSCDIANHAAGGVELTAIVPLAGGGGGES